MKNIILLLLFPVFVSASIHYPVNTISQKLMEDAYAVVRLEKTSFNITDAGKATLSTHLVVTILNERGAEIYDDFSTSYDKLSVVKEIKGYIYDQAGNEIFKLKKENITDIGLSALSTDISDSRKKIASFINKQYAFPYTIDFYDEVQTKNMMFYPTEFFVGEEHVSKEEQILEVFAPLNFEFRFKEINMPIKVEITSQNNVKKYLWKVQNIAADVYEEFRPSSTYPMVYTAPILFNIENYSGKIESWNDIGAFYAKLNENRIQLNDDHKAKILKLIADEKDTLEIIKKLYLYVQNNTRYMSIQLGIGGWQTATAQDVANKGYGDCKALSNYFLSILNIAGIKAHVALVRAGRNAKLFDADFPRFNFNHVICCVPIKNDTMWFECTSQTNAPAYLGSFTANRKALLITENGGVLVNTSKYNALQNVIDRHTNINVSTSANTTALVKTIYTGIPHEEINYVYHNLNQEQQKKYLQGTINLPMSAITSYNLKSNFSQPPQLIEELNITARGLLNQSGLTYLLRPNIWYEKSENLTVLKERNHEFYLSPNSFCQQEIDSITIILPPNIAPEAIPQATHFESKFGDYMVSYQYEKQVLTYTRKLVLKAGLFEATEYKNWIDFNKKVDKLDRQEIALITRE
jgi:hypothetical protein